jgi:hypothetical protein
LLFPLLTNREWKSRKYVGVEFADFERRFRQIRAQRYHADAPPFFQATRIHAQSGQQKQHASIVFEKPISGFPGALITPLTNQDASSSRKD